MRALASTAPSKDADADSRDSFRKVFACHDSPEGQECACAGYVARDGRYNLSLRYLAAQSNTALGPIIERAEKHDLYNDFHEMLADYEVHYAENEQ